MASLDDIKKLLEEQAKNIEDKMEKRINDVRVALLSELGSGAGKSSASGKAKELEQPNLPPVINLEDIPARTGAEIEAQKMKEKLELLERSITALKTHKEVVDMDSLSLFPDARLPTKFKMPNMDKFDGTTCPKTHLKMYVGALNPFGLSNELLAQLFQQSLTGAALRWFVSLDHAKMKTWEDICNAFNTQYHYNIEVDVTRRELDTTK